MLSGSVISNSLPLHGLYSTRLLCPWDFPGKNIEMGCHFLLQGIFPTQGWNLHLLRLLHWQVDYLHCTTWEVWETWVQSFGQEDSLLKEIEPTPIFLPGKSHGQRSLVSYSPWGSKELDMTEQLNNLYKETASLSLPFKMQSKFALISSVFF